MNFHHFLQISASPKSRLKGINQRIQHFLSKNQRKLLTGREPKTRIQRKATKMVKAGNAHLNCEGEVSVRLTSLYLLVRNQLFQDKLRTFFIFKTT